MVKMTSVKISLSIIASLYILHMYICVYTWARWAKYISNHENNVPFRLLHICYAHLGSAGFEYYVCCGPLTATYITLLA